MPNFLLEIGTEELPADFVDDALNHWKTRIRDNLATEFLTPDTVEVYGTPRRLAVLITGLPPKQPEREEEIKGPPAQAAFKDGKPTQAAEGFVRKQGVSLDVLKIKETDKGEFVFIHKQIVGRQATEILQELAPKWITELEGRRFMRWGDGDLRFPRPIRTLVALLDGDVVPIELVNGSTVIKSDRLTRGHPILYPQPVTIPEASAYLESLAKAYIEVDPEKRSGRIKEQIEVKAQELGGKAEIYPELLAEVNNLLEYPTAVLGSFEEEFLQLPTEVITTVMVKHQRYFPIKKQNGSLLPNFITISNGDPAKSEVIATGNAKVIRARLADAQFFYQADCDEHLESYIPELENVTFQEELGSMRDKVDRILEISQQIAQQLDVDEQEQREIESTALLCKADLVTQMVHEFPELQGVMGEKYALVSGESETVARGIFEHYLPRGAEDIMPETINGQVVGISDRLDTIVCIFGLGMIPTGSSDPFALRRAANGIVNITWHGNLAINLGQLVEQACVDFVTAHPDKESPLATIEEFFLQRIATLLEDELEIDYDLVNAVLGENDPEYSQRALKDLLDVRERAQFLQQIRQNGILEQIYETVNRSTCLAAQGDLDAQQLDPQVLVTPDLFEAPSEQSFYEAMVKLLPLTEQVQAESNYQLLVDALAEIAPIVSNFFDGEDSVLVMAEDDKIKRNRLNLLGLLRNHARILADFGAIVKI
jgi:glycyl-tRNA synthetase beta chain